MGYISMCRGIWNGFEDLDPYIGYHFCSFWHGVHGVSLDRVKLCPLKLQSANAVSLLDA